MSADLPEVGEQLTFEGIPYVVTHVKPFVSKGQEQHELTLKRPLGRKVYFMTVYGDGRREMTGPIDGTRGPTKLLPVTAAVMPLVSKVIALHVVMSSGKVRMVSADDVAKLTDTVEAVYRKCRQSPTLVRTYTRFLTCMETLSAGAPFPQNTKDRKLVQAMLDAHKYKGVIEGAAAKQGEKMPTAASVVAATESAVSAEMQLTPEALDAFLDHVELQYRRIKRPPPAVVRAYDRFMAVTDDLISFVEQGTGSGIDDREASRLTSEARSLADSIAFAAEVAKAELPSDAFLDEVATEADELVSKQPRSDWNLRKLRDSIMLAVRDLKLWRRLKSQAYTSAADAQAAWDIVQDELEELRQQAAGARRNRSSIY